MDFSHTEERQMLADMVGRFVRDEYDIETRHANARSDDGFSRAHWSQLAELGLIGALFPESCGGFGGTGFDISVVFEQLGGGLVVEPFLANLLAGTALAASGTHSDVLDEVMAGNCLLAYAHGEPASRYSLSQVETVAQKSGSGYRLNGNKAVVISGDTANKLVVSARTAGGNDATDGISLFLVPADADGIHIRSYPTIDGYRAAEIALKDVEVPADSLIGVEGQAIALIEQVNAAGTLAVSAEALGAIDVGIEMTLDYLKTRKQFGVPIGKFQALQHRMADMMTEREQIRSALINAAGNLQSDQRDWHMSALKNLIGRAGRSIAEECIQMHGGIAMTFEYAVGHYAKRVVMIDHMFGDEDHHLQRIIKLGAIAATAAATA
ncbi:MAG: pimeloyl-CoA dehydrogenase small subunit [Rhizobiaceae bacterium]|nr:pimeloyl-CoA dehydrogenase small subunit [Rhizobiaceae bacterium]